MNVLDALDDGISALTWLRQQLAAGQIDEGILQDFIGSGWMDHELLKRALSAQAGGGSAGGVAPGGDSPEAAAGDKPSESPGEPASAAVAGDGEEADVSSPHAEAEQLVARLARVPGALTAQGIPVPDAAKEFCQKAGRAASGLPDDDKKSELLAALLFKGVAILDSIDAALIWSGQRPRVKSILDDLRLDLAACLERDHGLTFVPAVDLACIDPEDPPGAAEISWTPAPEPAGTVLAVLARAFVRDGAEGGKSRLIVARGEPGELRAQLLEIWQHVESDGAGDPRADLAKLTRWIAELDDEDEAAQLSTMRHVLNLIHDRNAAQTHGAQIKWLLARLAERGITEVTARVGRRFDDSYSPSKYERQLVYSDQPAGTIVSIVRRGLLDPGGLPLQKAVLGVSRGNG